MAAQICNARVSTCTIDSSFDLDDALTMTPPPSDLDLIISDDHEPNPSSLNYSVVDYVRDHGQSGAVCGVCMEEFEEEEEAKEAVVEVRCGHLYHESCVSSWLCHSDSCPLCRFIITIT